MISIKLKVAVFLSILFIVRASAQNNATVFDPNDAVRYLDANSQPAAPANNNIVYKWYATKTMSWATTSYKAYIYNRMAFRLKYPKNYNPADTSKKYPVILALHGAGEKGTIYDNEQQLRNGGSVHLNAVDNGTFDGFLLFPQSVGAWYDTYYDNIAGLIGILQNNLNIDINRISVHGYSNGARGCIEILRRYPKLFASSLPFSIVGGWDEHDKFVEIPLWISQGGVDNNPSPTYTEDNINILRNKGANVTYTLYPEIGHGTWNYTYQLPDFFPYMLRAYKSNPLIYFGRSEFCPGDVINVKLGLTPGFDGYQWRKDGVVLANKTSNTLQVTAYGSYQARIRRGTKWSEWSPIPAVIKPKGETVSPTIKVSGLASNVLPAGDGATSVKIGVPANYEEYEWRKVGSTTVLGTSNQLVVSEPGEYIVKIREQYGCTSNFSEPFKVIAANGANKPNAPFDLKATALSKNEIRITWQQDAAPQNSETGFEIYRKKLSDANYTLAGITAANSASFKDSLLSSNTGYIYAIRAINLSGASALSPSIESKTLADLVPPTAPFNLRIVGSSRTDVDLVWEFATDDVGIDHYDVYVNDQKSYSTNAETNAYRVNNLVAGQIYSFKVASVDVNGNSSILSNQAITRASNNGLSYRYYETEETWKVLPNFNALTPTYTGKINNFDISVRNRDTKYGVVYEGFINIPVTGNYTFETNADDGSRLYIGSYNPTATSLVNNDGAHSAQYREGTIYLTQGLQPIAVTYYQGTGSGVLQVYWKNTANGVTDRQLIPDQYFQDSYPALVAPAAPSSVNAIALSYNKVKVTWKDNSTNETGFEVYRSLQYDGTYEIIGRAAADATEYIDTKVSASTAYFYKVKAFGTEGESSTSGATQELALNFNNNYTDQSGLAHNGAGVNSPTFITTSVKEGTHAVSLDGTNDYIEIGEPDPGFLHTTFTSRTIAFWVNPQLLTSVRTLLDIGSYANGISLRTNLTNLELAVAVNNTRKTLTTPIAVGNWYHVAVSYKGNTVRYYINGVLAGSIDDLAYSTIIATTDGSRIGYRNGNNAFNNNSSTYFKGYLDAFHIYNEALTASEVQQLYALTPFNNRAKTLDIAVPNAPVLLTAVPLSPKKVKLTWQANADTTVSYSVYRSIGSNAFEKIKGDIINVAAFTDSSLVGNTSYSYKITAANAGGESIASNVLSATTLNSSPVLAAIPNKLIRFDETTVIKLVATDAENDVITFSLPDAHSFTSLTTSNGITSLTINPTMASVGSYSISVNATDTHGASDTKAFNLVINQNSPPVLTMNQTTLSVNEGTTSEFAITGTDSNTEDSLAYSLTSAAPPFVTVVQDSTVRLKVKANYANAGTYSFYVKVDDQQGGTDSLKINLTVVDVEPGYKIYVNFTGSSTEGGIWNNTTAPVSGVNFPALKNDKSATTPVGLLVTSSWEEWWNSANNIGMYSNALYPVSVTNTSWGVNSGSQSFKLTGLNQSLSYKLTFLASSQFNNVDYTSKFTVDSQTVSINASGNASNLVEMNSLTPNESGEIAVAVSSNAGGVAVMNALIIEASAASTEAPGTPANLSASLVNKATARLTWMDQSFDESSFEIFGSKGNEPFANIGSVTSNKTEFTTPVKGNYTYKFKIQAKNAFGPSTFSNEVSLIVPNKVPELTVSVPSEVKTDETSTITIGASDDEGEILSFSTLNLPSFITAETAGTGSYKLVINPSASDVGEYSNIIINVSDNFGGIAKDTLTVKVLDNSFVSIPVNFNNGWWNGVEGWNNTDLAPTADLTLPNLKDSKGNLTGSSLTLLDSWSGSNDLGMTTGNSSGIYPDNVMMTNYYDDSATGRNIKIAGLSTQKRYNFVFFNSWKNPWANGVTEFVINNRVVSLNPANNATQTAELNNIAANSNGEITVTIRKQSGAHVAYINAMIIEAFTPDNKTVAPTGLIAAGKSKTAIQLSWTDVADNESGYEIFRSSSMSGTYTLLTTLPANTSNYLNDNLTANSTYYYKVRAITSDGNNSDFTSVVVASTFINTISINFNRTDSAPSPWNNTAKNPDNGDKFINLVNENNVNTGVSMTLVDNFSGSDNLGMTIAGKYLATINKWFYYSEKNETAKIKFSGLNPALSYDFEFFASWMNNWTNVTTSYTIGTVSVAIDPANNLNRTAIISNVVPNQYGEVIIDVFMPYESQYAVLNAIQINSHAKNNLDEDSAVGLMASSTQKDGLNALMASTYISDHLDLVRAEEARNNKLNNNVITVYPNPFINKILVNLGKSYENNTKISLQLVDLNGRILKSQEENVSSGTERLELNVEDINMYPGIYILRINGDGVKGEAFKVIKR